MTASFGLRIFGSGTPSTRTSLFPYQHSAFILYLPDLFSLRIFLTSNGGPGMHLGVRPSQSVNRPDNFVQCRSSAAGLPVDSRNFAGLHQFFKAPQIFANLLLRFLAKQFRQLRTYASRWRVIDKLYPHLGSTTAWGGREPHPPAALDF